MTRRLRLPCLLLTALAAQLPSHAASIPQAASDIEAGRRIYEEGVLADGRALEATHAGGLRFAGGEAACVRCHRPSGMGGVEGDIQVQPITGNALFGTGDRVIATMDPRSGKAFNLAHDPYTDAQVAQMLRSGTRPDGRALNELMPHYELGERDQAALLAYLRQLSVDWSPGVTTDTIHFATVVTPDVPAARRALFIDMANRIVAQKNGSTKVAGQGTRHHMTSAAELVLGTERRWTLDVWQLEGAPDTWPRQLDAYYARSPVFALVSGLGGAEWAPVDDFCDRQRLPCWFPSVALPPTAAPRYSLYFSAGPALEARVLATSLLAAGARPPHQVIQLHDEGTVGAGAAQALSASLRGSAIRVLDRVVARDDPQALARALAEAQADPDDTALVLWFDPAQMAQLATLPAPRAQAYVSGTMAGGSASAVPAAWRDAVHVVYPYELPEKRAANLAYFHAWLNQRHLPLVDEVMQSEVYFAFAFLTDTVAEMLDNLHRDYLLERAETMINRREGGRAESEYYSSTMSHVRTRADEPAALHALRLAGSSFGVRAGTTIYPRLSLGPGQRFASKGAYLARIDDEGAIVADGAWITP